MRKNKINRSIPKNSCSKNYKDTAKKTTVTILKASQTLEDFSINFTEFNQTQDPNRKQIPEKARQRIVSVMPAFDNASLHAVGSEIIIAAECIYGANQDVVTEEEIETTSRKRRKKKF